MCPEKGPIRFSGDMVHPAQMFLNRPALCNSFTVCMYVCIIEMNIKTGGPGRYKPLRSSTAESDRVLYLLICCCCIPNAKQLQREAIINVLLCRKQS